MKQCITIIVALILFGYTEAQEKLTQVRLMDYLQLYDGSKLLGTITKDLNTKDPKQVITFKTKCGVKMVIPDSCIEVRADDIPDPEQFAFPEIPENAKTWKISVDWLQLQLNLHELYKMPVYEIAIDTLTHKLYLKGFRPDIQGVFKMESDSLKRDGYYERIPPDGP